MLMRSSRPAPIVPWILSDCVANGHRNVHIFSAGFGVTGEEQGKALQAEITKVVPRIDPGIGPVRAPLTSRAARW